MLTHPDADHASGFETVLRDMRVAFLWMNRPWKHVDLLMNLFERYQDRDRLMARLKRAFPKVAALEELALAQSVQIRDAFQGDRIGAFTVLSPSLYTYLLLVAQSEKTSATDSVLDELLALLDGRLSSAAWGEVLAAAQKRG